MDNVIKVPNKKALKINKIIGLFLLILHSEIFNYLSSYEYKKSLTENGCETLVKIH